MTAGRDEATEPDPDPRRAGAGRGMARRAARNAAAQGVAEMLGKFSTLALMAVLAREEGPAGLGVLVFGLAWSELASTPVDMGYDRQVQRILARDPSRLPGVLANVLLLKARRAVPVVAGSFVVLWLVEDDRATQLVVALLTATYLLESVRFTLFGVFVAHERADLVGAVLVVQRLLSGGGGILVLGLGYGVVAVAGAYVLAAAVAVLAAGRLLARHVGWPPIAFPRADRREFERYSWPFAAQELLSAGMARLDVLLLAAFASEAIVGAYGAAYRMLEASLLVSTALLGAFSAMFSYLEPDSEPTVGAAFARAVKLSLVLLVPCAVPLALLPGEVIALFFGPGFAAGASALVVLAPTVLLLGNVMLTAALIGARLDPRLLLKAFALAFAINTVGNLALIPWLGATGAALAMLACEGVLCVVMLRICVRAVGAPPPLRTVGAATVGAVAMAATLLLVPGPTVVVLLAGAATYAAAFALVERKLAPEDLRVLVGLLAERLPRRRAAAL